MNGVYFMQLFFFVTDSGASLQVLIMPQ